MNGLLKIISRQRKKNISKAVRRYKSNAKEDVRISQTSVQALSNLLSNNLNKYSAEEIINIYETKYKNQSSTLSEENASLSIGDLYKEVVNIKLLLQEITLSHSCNKSHA